MLHSSDWSDINEYLKTKQHLIDQLQSTDFHHINSRSKKKNFVDSKEILEILQIFLDYHSDEYELLADVLARHLPHLKSSLINSLCNLVIANGGDRKATFDDVHSQTKDIIRLNSSFNWKKENCDRIILINSSPSQLLEEFTNKLLNVRQMKMDGNDNHFQQLSNVHCIIIDCYLVRTDGDALIRKDLIPFCSVATHLNIPIYIIIPSYRIVSEIIVGNSKMRILNSSKIDSFLSSDGIVKPQLIYQCSSTNHSHT
ncbi:hypothetical protein SNEBB_007453 [Seison nebaliae]|nr:hypothetical protein SNEBB_007453 [Seison nebaliae]